MLDIRNLEKSHYKIQNVEIYQIMAIEIVSSRNYVKNEK